MVEFSRAIRKVFVSDINTVLNGNKNNPEPLEKLIDAAGANGAVVDCGISKKISKKMAEYIRAMHTPPKVKFHPENPMTESVQRKMLSSRYNHPISDAKCK